MKEIPAPSDGTAAAPSATEETASAGTVATDGSGRPESPEKAAATPGNPSETKDREKPEEAESAEAPAEEPADGAAEDAATAPPTKDAAPADGAVRSGGEKADDGEKAEGPYSEEAMALWPDVEDLVTSPFGESRGGSINLLTGERLRSRYHSGLDVRGHLGWPVRSLRDGTVVSSGMSGAAGILVKIEQDDGKTVAYAHLGEAFVKKGQRVTRGQHIGKVGCTGRTSGAHLHITVRDAGGNLIDPEKEIAGLWEIYDPPIEDLRAPIKPQACNRGGINRRLIGQRQYLRMHRNLVETGLLPPDEKLVR